MRLLVTLFMLPPADGRQEKLLRAADGEAVVIGRVRRRSRVVLALALSSQVTFPA